MKFLRYLPIFILSSCGQTEVAKPVANLKWFDLKKFVDSANVILPKNAPFEKTLWVKNSSETRKVTIADWSNELAVFAQADINRPAWRDKYQVDTFPVAVERKAAVEDDTTAMHQIQHIAIDKSLRTRSLSISMNRKWKPLVIEVLSEQNNFFSHSQQHLTWDLRSGYSITAQQKMLLMSATETTLSGRFLK
ncbi:MAG: hypothetical protein RIS64_160 [Bacteroidota bacterium]|jgi:hypothetical protein